MVGEVEIEKSHINDFLNQMDGGTREVINPVSFINIIEERDTGCNGKSEKKIETFEKDEVCTAITDMEDDGTFDEIWKQFAKNYSKEHSGAEVPITKEKFKENFKNFLSEVSFCTLETTTSPLIAAKNAKLKVEDYCFKRPFVKLLGYVPVVDQIESATLQMVGIFLVIIFTLASLCAMITTLVFSSLTYALVFMYKGISYSKNYLFGDNRSDEYKEDLIALKKQFLEKVSNSDEGTFGECSICLEDLISSTPTTHTQCKHTLHSECLKNVLISVGEQHIQCPLCRAFVKNYSV